VNKWILKMMGGVQQIKDIICVCKGILNLQSNCNLALVLTLAHQHILGHTASGHPSPLDCLGAPYLTPSIWISIVAHASL